MAILVSDGVDGDAVARMKSALASAGAYVKIVAPRIGNVSVSAGSSVYADGTISNSPSVFFDAMYIPGGTNFATLTLNGGASNFAYETYAYYKAIAASGKAIKFLINIGLLPESGAPVPQGVLTSTENNLTQDFIQGFINNIAQHRFYYRTDVAAIPS